MAASENVIQNKSPYNEKTYRYTPIISYLILPNFIFGQEFGKLLFCFFDFLCAILMYFINKQSNDKFNIWPYIHCIWFFNPLIITVSSRGNAEALLGVFVLLTIYLLKARCIILAGIVFSLCIHLKLYPVIYSFSIFFYLSNNAPFPYFLKPTRNHIKFALSAMISLALISTLFFSIYGMEFIYNSYLYHFYRVDIKHNFSIYFYPQYLLSITNFKKIFGVVSFIPQFVILIAFSWKHKYDLSLSWLLCTIGFVAFNKVATSQYFMWHLFLLPNVICKFRLKKLIPLILSYCMWFLSQAVWLYGAYKLEFEGQQVFLNVWLSSILLMVSHILKLKVLSSLFTNETVKIKSS